MLKNKKNNEASAARELIEDQIWSVHGPDENCPCRNNVCQRCRWHIWASQVMVENAWDAYLQASGSQVKEDVKERMYSDGYSEGYSIAVEEAQSSIHQYQDHIQKIEAFYNQKRLEQNQLAQRSYQEGFSVGYSNGRNSAMLSDGSSGSVSQSGFSTDKKKLIEDMLEQCRIIAESNPNMAPGVNAVRHRLKKL